jgi:hypothetical protein
MGSNYGAEDTEAKAPRILTLFVVLKLHASTEKHVGEESKKTLDR